MYYVYYINDESVGSRTALYQKAKYGFINIEWNAIHRASTHQRYTDVNKKIIMDYINNVMLDSILENLINFFLTEYCIYQIS